MGYAPEFTITVSSATLKEMEALRNQALRRIIGETVVIDQQLKNSSRNKIFPLQAKTYNIGTSHAEGAGRHFLS